MLTLTTGADQRLERIRAIRPEARTTSMRVLSLISQKGGTGKTTLALHLAGAGHAAGSRTAVIDLDPQGSAALWADLRMSPGPDIVPVEVDWLAEALDAASRDGIDLAVIDTAPHSEGVALSAAHAADLVAIPCGVSILDLQAVTASIELAAMANSPALGILNAVPPRGRLKEEVREELCGFDLDVAVSEIGQRMALRHALVAGHLVAEYEPRGKAAAELSALWREIAGRLGLPAETRTARSLE